MKYKLRKIVFIICGALLSACAVGCSIIAEDAYPIDSQPREINPLNQQASGGRVKANLYFRYNEEELLSIEERELDVPAGERLEDAVLQALLAGPSENTRNLSSMFNDNVTAISVTSSKDYLFVTLSKEFFNAPPGAPDDWEKQPEWFDEVMMRRRLSVYSIANTLTDLGNYSRVQILVDVYGNGNGQRVKRGEMGFLNDDPNEILEQVAWNMDVVMTPARAAEEILGYFRDKQVQFAYEMISGRDIEGVVKPGFDEFKAEFEEYACSVEAYLVGGWNISADGQSAVISVDYSIRYNDDRVVQNTEIPIRLVREDGSWKLTYPSFQLLYTER